MNPTKKHCVMVIEDEDLLLQAISKKLELNQIEPITCTTGQQALDYLNNLPEMPDAIWLDYHLPDMDGIAVMNQLKTKPEWSKIPVFVISNSATDSKVHSMLALGVKKYIVKAEHRLDEIIQQVVQFIESERSI